MGRKSVFFMLAVAILASMWTAGFTYTPKETTKQSMTVPPECLKALGDHHTPSAYLQNAIKTGNYKAWLVNKRTVILAFRVAECGYHWMYAKYSSGTLVTHFFPSENSENWVGWEYYIRPRVRGLKYVTPSVARRVIAGAGASLRTAPLIIIPNPKSWCYSWWWYVCANKVYKN